MSEWKLVPFPITPIMVEAAKLASNRQRYEPRGRAWGDRLAEICNDAIAAAPECSAAERMEVHTENARLRAEVERLKKLLDGAGEEVA